MPFCCCAAVLQQQAGASVHQVRIGQLLLHVCGPAFFWCVLVHVYVCRCKVGLCSMWPR